MEHLYYYCSERAYQVPHQLTHDTQLLTHIVLYSAIQVDVTGDDYQGQLPTAETYMAQLAGHAIAIDAAQMEELLVPQVLLHPNIYPSKQFSV